MTEDRLIEVIDAFGADPSVWPVTDAEAAASMLAAPSARVQSALDEAMALDAELAELIGPEPPEHLHAAILDSAPRPAAARPRRWFNGMLQPAWSTGAALASLAVGFVMGTTLLAEPTQSEPGESAVYAALGIEAYGFDFIEEGE